MSLLILIWLVSICFLLCTYAGFIGESVGFADRECMVWYILFIIFVPYAMLPLPLKYCMIGGSVSGAAHLLVITIVKTQKNSVSLHYLYLLCILCHSDENRFAARKWQYLFNWRYISSLLLQAQSTFIKLILLLIFLFSMSLPAHMQIGLSILGYEMYCTTIAGKFIAVFGNKFCWYVHQIFNGSWTTFGIHWNA